MLRYFILKNILKKILHTLVVQFKTICLCPTPPSLSLICTFVLQLCCQICTIVSNIPHLDFLNLSMNPLSGVELEPSMGEIFSRVRQLVLINTQVSWETVHTLTQHTPE